MPIKKKVKMVQLSPTMIEEGQMKFVDKLVKKTGQSKALIVRTALQDLKEKMESK